MRESWAFGLLVGSLNQDVNGFSTGLETWIERAAAKLDPTVRAEAKRFVADVLSRGHSDEDILTILDEADFNFYVSAGGERRLFERLLAVL